MTRSELPGALPRSGRTAPPGLGRAGGVAAGFASVVGAGLLGLPAAVLHETGSAAVLTWLVAAALCIPMIMLFRDTVLGTPDSSDPLRDAVRVVDLLAAASAVFVVIYLICIAAYARTNGLRPWPVANLALVPIMAVSLWQSGPRSLYAVAVLLVTALVTHRQRTIRRRS